jgi:hypothetical protein
MFVMPQRGLILTSVPLALAVSGTSYYSVYITPAGKGWGRNSRVVSLPPPAMAGTLEGLNGDTGVIIGTLDMLG